MKTALYSILACILFSCAGAGINSFYDTHKYDPGATAIEVPKFVLNMLKNSSQEMNHILSNVDDIRFMNLPAGDPRYTEQLGKEIDRITAGRYADIFRRTDEQGNTSLFSLKERGDRIKELIWFDQGSQGNLLLYFKGDFDPEVISKLSDSGEINLLKDLIENQD